MKQILYKNEKFEARPDETVLDCLTRHQVIIPHSCKSGVCQSCVLKVKKGNPSPAAQKGLNEDLIKQNVIFSCQQKAEEDLELVEVGEGLFESDAIITGKKMLSESVVEISLKLNRPMDFRPGQFINLIRQDGVTRPYSICWGDSHREMKLHVRKIPTGKMSSWLYDEQVQGLEMVVRGPVGRCYYKEEFNSMDIILAGTGTGLAPLYGILLSALKKNHSGNLHLLQGAVNPSGLYLVEELKALENLYSNFHYTPCVMEGANSSCVQGNLLDLAKDQKVQINNTVVFLCGDPKIVNKMKTNFFLKGIPSKNILSDPFVYS